MLLHSYVFWMAFSALLCLLLERWRPWRDQPFLREEIGQDGLWFLLNGYLLSLVLLPVYQGMEQLLERGFSGVAGTPAGDVRALGGWPWWAQVPAVLVLRDFLEWCVHNLLHRVPWLWSVHRVHHSIRTMDWIGNYRFHWGEVLVYHACTFLPLRLLGASWETLLVVGSLATLVGCLNHSNVFITWGPLKYVFNSPVMHLWHHDTAMHHRSGQNFGVVFSAWDWLFGTAWLPAGRTPERLGFRGDEHLPRAFLWRFWLPFLDRRER